VFQSQKPLASRFWLPETSRPEVEVDPDGVHWSAPLTRAAAGVEPAHIGLGQHAPADTQDGEVLADGRVVMTRSDLEQADVLTSHWPVSLRPTSIFCGLPLASRPMRR